MCSPQSTNNSALVPCVSETQELIYVEVNGRVGQLFFNPTTQEQVVQFSSENVCIEQSDMAESTGVTESEGPNDLSEVIWANNRKRGTEVDHVATQAFLQLIKSDKFQAMLNDKKTTKKYVYQLIGKEMVSEGFNFGTASITEIGEKCDQKWRNLEKKYHEHNKRVVNQTGGAGGVKEPPYYDTIHSIIGNRHANAPVRILQSSCSEENEEVAGTNKSLVSPVSGKATAARRPLKQMRAEKRKCSEAEANDSKEIDEDEDDVAPSSPFLSVKSSTKPKKKISNSEIVKKMEEFHAEEMKAQEKQFKEFSKYMKATTKQRSQLIGIFGKAFAGSSKKTPMQGDESSESNSSSKESSEDEAEQGSSAGRAQKMKKKKGRYD